MFWKNDYKHSLKETMKFTLFSTVKYLNSSVSFWIFFDTPTIIIGVPSLYSIWRYFSSLMEYSGTEFAFVRGIVVDPLW